MRRFRRLHGVLGNGGGPSWEKRELSRKPSSNVVQLSAKMRRGRGGEGASLKFVEPSAVTVVPLSGSHVAAFAAECLVTAPGASLATADIRLAYEAWCAAKGHEPLWQQKLSAELLRVASGNILRSHPLSGSATRRLRRSPAPHSIAGWSAGSITDALHSHSARSSDAKPLSRTNRPGGIGSNQRDAALAYKDQPRL